MDPHWFQCGFGSIFFISVLTLFRIQGPKPVRIHTDPDQALTKVQKPFERLETRLYCQFLYGSGSGTSKSMRFRIHNTSFLIRTYAIVTMMRVCAGSWCPPIYFNHLCYSASFLRKPRLEALPKYIGPGPVGLCLRN